MINKNIIKITLVTLFLILSAIAASSEISGTVVCFGDSITHGAKVEGKSYVYYLSRNHPNVNFVNAGRNGRKTSDKKQILPVLEEHPDADYFLIFLGVNDLKDGTPEMVDGCVENMDWMIKQVKQTNSETKIVIIAPTDINLNTMDSVNVRKKYNSNTKQSLVLLRDRYQQLAKEDSVEFISLLDVVTQPNYVDGLHPNRKGQQEIAGAVWEKLNQLYQ